VPRSNHKVTISGQSMMTSMRCGLEGCSTRTSFVRPCIPLHCLSQLRLGRFVTVSLFSLYLPILMNDKWTWVSDNVGVFVAHSRFLGLSPSFFSVSFWDISIGEYSFSLAVSHWMKVALLFAPFLCRILQWLFVIKISFSSRTAVSVTSLSQYHINAIISLNMEVYVC